MHYWREGYFESLKIAATSAKQASDAWQGYADFCLEYEQGLRKQAFIILEKFIHKMEREPFGERRRFVSWLMAMAEGQEGKHMLIPHPLFVRVVEPTLLEWAEVEPDCSEPHRWLGDREHLEKAVELDPKDSIAVRKLIRKLLSQVSYATHELPLGYIGSASEDLADLATAESLLSGLESEDDRVAYAADIAEHRDVIMAYMERRQ